MSSQTPRKILVPPLAMLFAASLHANEVTLSAADGLAADNFGVAVVVDGGVAVVGALNATVGGKTFHGAAYVFEKEAGGSWSEIQKLLPSDGAEFGLFGETVAIDGETIVVGAPRAEVGGVPQQGAVYVFERSGPLWTETRKLTESVGSFGHFGSALAIEGDRLIVGADGDELAQVRERDVGGAGQWGVVDVLEPSDGFPPDEFGSAVGVRGDVVAVGARRADVTGLFENDGAVYVYEPDVADPSDWVEIDKLTADDAEGSDFFGGSIALTDGLLVVGATGADAGSELSAGAAYVFELLQGTWTQVHRVLGATGGASLGRAVGVGGQTVLIGEATSAFTGRVLLFEKDTGGPGNWGSLGEVEAPVPAIDDQFGSAIALDGGTVAIGAFGSDAFRGAAYLCEDLVDVPLAEIFADGFESGDVSTWTSSVP